jgi:hypothetical protein
MTGEAPIIAAHITLSEIKVLLQEIILDCMINFLKLEGTEHIKFFNALHARFLGVQLIITTLELTTLELVDKLIAAGGHYSAGVRIFKDF